MDTRALRDELLRLELALARRDPAGVDGGLIALIADDFLEFGRSGRVWTAESMDEVLDLPMVTVDIEDFEVTELADGVVLATYLVPGPTAVNRSSIWIRRGGRWVIRFHQGTTRAEGERP